MGDACEEAKLQDEALTWYRHALNTCAQGDEFSENVALTAFLRLTGGNIPPADHNLLASVVRKSWRVLELAGSPNQNNLPECIRVLSNHLLSPWNASLEIKASINHIQSLH